MPHQREEHYNNIINNNVVNGNANGCNNGLVVNNGHHHANNGHGGDPSVTTCCVPADCSVGQPLHMTNLADAIKVVCNNDQCPEGRYMHKQCFDEWEATVLTFLKTTGRARSWSEKQRLQNLWTKKGYDLAYKACGCKCGKGHLRKDLDWQPPQGLANGLDDAQDKKKKKNRKKRGSDKPTVNVGGLPAVKTPPKNGGQAAGSPPNGTNNSNGTTNNQQHQIQQQQLARLRSFSMSSTGSGGSSDGHSPPAGSSPTANKFFFAADPNNGNINKMPNGNGIGGRERHNSGSIFSRRSDYSAFNTLPRHKINSYHIKMEDDGHHGNDETRCFILSTLSANKMNRTACCLCQSAIPIYDRYPLVDGTFFLSPRQHNQSAVPVRTTEATTTVGGQQQLRQQAAGVVQYMNAVCMACLEGWSASIRCRRCRVRWNGKHLIIGSMYSYDIFAAVPCCPDRLRCNNCRSMVVQPDRRFGYFSDYSRPTACPNCGIVDHHFVKPLQATYVQD